MEEGGDLLGLKWRGWNGTDSWPASAMMLLHGEWREADGRYKKAAGRYKTAQAWVLAPGSGDIGRADELKSAIDPFSLYRTGELFGPLLLGKMHCSHLVTSLSSLLPHNFLK